MKKYIYFIVFLAFFINFYKLKAQNIDTIAILIEQVRTEKDLNTRIEMAKKTDSIFYEVGKKTDFSVNYPQNLQKYTSRLISDDKKVVVVTWNIFLENGQYLYFGYIQYKNSPKEIYTYHLIDKSDEISNPENSKLTIDKWFGCLYYDIIEKKAGKKKIYTLLGWDGNNYLTNKKIIEVITFSNQKPSFGYQFNLGTKKTKRIIFEYNKEANMNLLWDENQKMIIWDHLSPSEPKFEGIYQYYGPDFTYDGLVFKKKKWNFVENVEPKNTQHLKSE